VAEIEDHTASQALSEAARKHGFTPSHAVVELDGTCEKCSLLGGGNPQERHNNPP
jgi:Fe2+ or Zn2+ uptake regulation protein